MGQNRKPRNPRKSTSTRTYKAEETSAAVCAAATVSAEWPLFFKTSSCHKNRKGWLGGLVVFGVLVFMGNNLFLNCSCRPAGESAPFSAQHECSYPWMESIFSSILTHSSAALLKNSILRYLYCGIPGNRATCMCFALVSELYMRVDLIRCICHNRVQLQQLLCAINPLILPGY